jgi:hypothetical protein
MVFGMDYKTFLLSLSERDQTKIRDHIIPWLVEGTSIDAYNESADDVLFVSKLRREIGTACAVVKARSYRGPSGVEFCGWDGVLERGDEIVRDGDPRVPGGRGYSAVRDRMSLDQVFEWLSGLSFMGASGVDLPLETCLFIGLQLRDYCMREGVLQCDVWDRLQMEWVAKSGGTLLDTFVTLVDSVLSSDCSTVLRGAMGV